MRLREIKQILDENIKELKVDNSSDLGNAKYEIKNFHDLYVAIRKIEKLGFLQEDIAILDTMQTIFHDKSEKVIVDNNGLNKLKERVNLIRLKVDTVIKAINEALPEQDQNSVSIKLPNYTELSQVSNFIKEIDTILNQTLVDDFKGNIKLQNFDTGSNWIEILLENKEAVLFLGAIVGSTINFIQSSYLHWKQTEHTIKVLNTDEEARKLILKSISDSVKFQAQSHASALMKDFNIDASHQEYHTNLTYSIHKLAELMSKGTEIHTALNAPEDTKQAFPDAKTTQSLIENATKLLTDGTTENINK
jgi:hypothetical protein